MPSIFGKNIWLLYCLALGCFSVFPQIMAMSTWLTSIQAVKFPVSGEWTQQEGWFSSSLRVFNHFPPHFHDSRYSCLDPSVEWHWRDWQALRPVLSTYVSTMFAKDSLSHHVWQDASWHSRSGQACPACSCGWAPAVPTVLLRQKRSCPFLEHSSS